MRSSHDLLNGNAQLHLSQASPAAGMNATTEHKVRVRTAVNATLVRISEQVFVPVRRSPDQEDLVTLGYLTGPELDVAGRGTGHHHHRRLMPQKTQRPRQV